jgi:hypothetical protein
MSRRAKAFKSTINEADMIRIALISAFLTGCAGAKPGEAPADTNPAPAVSFIPLDSSYKSAPRELRPVIALDEKELMAAPAFKAVGVVQLEGKETKQLKAFFDAVAVAGAQAGCDVLFQRDAFELGARVPKPMLPGGGGIGKFIASSGREWHRSDRLMWQFLCGVTGANAGEQEETMTRATFLAVQLRRKALGSFEPCEQYTPLGSHVRRRDVCANDIGKKRDVASSNGAQTQAQ